MAILNRRGNWSVPVPAQDRLESAERARPARNRKIQQGLVARLQELVEKYMPEELEFFCDWLSGNFTDDELWEKHVHATVETNKQCRGGQLAGRRRSIFVRLQKLAEDDVQIQLLLDSMEGYVHPLHRKDVSDNA